MKYERMQMCLTMPFFEQRKRGVMPYDLDPKVVEPLISGALTNDWREMFDVALFEDYPLTRHGESFNAVQCVGCRELVVREYAVEWKEQMLSKQLTDTISNQLTKIIAREQRSGLLRANADPEFLAQSFLGTLYALITRWEIEGHLPWTEDVIVRQLVDGLLP